MVLQQSHARLDTVSSSFGIKRILKKREKVFSFIVMFPVME